MRLPQSTGSNPYVGSCFKNSWTDDQLSGLRPKMETIICSLTASCAQCVCMCGVAVHVFVCEKIAACMHVCVVYMYVYAHLPHPTHLPIWLWEQVYLIVHVIFGVGIQILKYPWESMVGGATCNHGQHSLL